MPPAAYAARIMTSRALAPKVHSITLRLERPMAFTPGQHVNLAFEGERQVRQFSIASAPSPEPVLELVIKRYGAFSRRLIEAEPGTRLALFGPAGVFTLSEGDAVLIAGGVGVVPFVSMLRHEARTRERRLTLLYAVQRREELLIEQELRALAGGDHIDVVLSLTRERPAGWEGELGRIDERILKPHLDPSRQYLLCGSHAMVAEITALLVRHVDPARIKGESWG